MVIPVQFRFRAPRNNQEVPANRAQGLFLRLFTTPWQLSKNAALLGVQLYAKMAQVRQQHLKQKQQLRHGQLSKKQR
jgi:hypothetical protein